MTGTVKLGIYLAIIVASAAAAKWAHDVCYKSGWNAAVVEQEHLIAKAREFAIAETELKWQALVDAAEGQIVVEEKIVEVIREVEKKIPVVVEKIVTVKPECNDLGSDFVSLWNEQVSAARSGNEVEGSGNTP